MLVPAKVLVTLSTLAFAASSFGATLPADQAVNANTTAVQTQNAQDSANGSMTHTDLTGNVTNDTSALSAGTTSGTTQGAIVDQTDASQIDRKKKKKKHKTTQKTTTQESSSSDQ